MKNFLKILCLALLIVELLFLEKLRIETPMLTESRIHRPETADTVSPAAPIPASSWVIGAAVSTVWALPSLST